MTETAEKHMPGRVRIHAPARFLPGIAFALVAMLAGCAHQPPAASPATRWQESRQLVLVTVADWNSDHGSLRTFSRSRGGAWEPAAPATPVVIGRAGAAWGVGLHDPQPGGPVKREGDGRSPAGVFTIGEAFGYAPAATTALPYEAMQASDYCVDVSGSPLYNRIVDALTVGDAAVSGSTEPMRRDLHADGDQRYRLGFVIEHNKQGIPMAGSCIFAHLWKSPTSATTGCTAMEPATMERLLSWLQPASQPVFVLLPEAEYARVQAAWGLPVVDARP